LKQNNSEKKIRQALIKRAVGYDAEEVVEEFSYDESGDQFLNKKKVSSKHFSPDVSAIKILLEYYGEKSFDELERMTDEELSKERDRLLLLLEKNYPQNEGRKKNEKN